MLLDVVQGLLFPTKPGKVNLVTSSKRKENKSHSLEDHRIADDHFSKLHNVLIVGSGKQHHLTSLGEQPVK